MSINVSVAFQIPTNVVEVGNEITSQQLSAITSGSAPTAANPFMTSSAVSTTYAAKASPTFTGTVTIPAGASISGYLTTSSAASTYQTISGMSSYATQSYVTSQGYLTDAPSNGSEYVRKDGAWSVATGGGGGGIPDAPAGSDYVRNGTSGWVLLSDFQFQTATDVSTYVTANAYPLSTNPAGYITGVPAKTVTNYTTSGNLTTSDVNNIAYLSGSAGMGFSMTVPDDSSGGWTDGDTITIVVDWQSSYTIQGGMGVAINGGSSSTILTYVTTLVKVAANTWYLS